MKIHDATETAYRNGYAKGREDALAADVVEVVRCKDCKHWEHEEDVDFVCTKHYGYRLSTDFCSSGERREV